MAQYFTNFSENSVGSGTPTGWTQRIKNAGGASSSIVSTSKGNVFKLNTATGGSYVFSYNALNNEQDVETLTLFRVVDTGQDGRFGINYNRYSGNSEASTKGYNANFTQASNVLSVFLVEDSIGVISYKNYAWSLNTWYYMRLRTVGTSLSVKIWAEGSVEPSTWLLEQTYSGPTITSPYSGVGHYVQNSSIEYSTFSAGTGGDTAPMYAITDREQTGAFAVDKIPDTADANGYSAGYGGISGYGGAYGEAYIPTSTTVDKEQVGKFNVAQVYDKPITGKFNIIKDYTNAQVGKFRVQTSPLKTQTGKFRVKSELTKSQIGKFRISTTSDSTQVGSFLVKKTYDKDQVGAFRVASEPLRLQIGRFLVQKQFTQSQTGVFSVAGPVAKTQVGKFRVKKLVNKTVIGKFRVQKTLDKPQIGAFKIRVINDYDISGKFRVAVRHDKPQTGSFLVEIAPLKNQLGKFAVLVVTNKPQTGNFRVQTYSEKLQSGKFTVLSRNLKSQVGQFRLEYQGNEHQNGKFRVYGENTIPEVFIPIESYIAKEGSHGVVGTAEASTGDVYAAYDSIPKLVETTSIDGFGAYNPDGESTGRIYSNNEHVILLWDDGSVWISEVNEEIMVEEYEESGIMNMIPKKGTFYEGKVENGNIQESL